VRVRVPSHAFEPVHPFVYRTGQLFVGDRPLSEVAEALDTPFFVIDEGRLKRNYSAIRDGLSAAGGEVRIRYCAKTNNEKGLLEVLAGLGSGVLASYPEEVALALEAGFSPDKVAYQRPVLVESEVRAALSAGIRHVHAYRLADVELLEHLAAQAAVTIRVSLRLRHESPRFSLSPLGFMSRRLGFDGHGIMTAAQAVCGSQHLRLAGLNFYRGTQQDSPRRFERLLSECFRIAAAIRERFGVTVEEINLGGGVPSHSLRRNGLARLGARWWDAPVRRDDPDRLRLFSQSLAERYRKLARDAGFTPAPAVGIEPGRSVAGDTGFLVTRVIACDGDWLFLDASRNFLGESVVMFTRRILPGSVASGQTRFYHLSGNTLNTGDVIDFRRRLPVCGTGDLLVFCNAGAYSISRASRYAGLCPAVYVRREDGAFNMVRRRERFEDLTAPMVCDFEERGGGA
jgi:diaminopimelate decarboxylase